MKQPHSYNSSAHLKQHSPRAATLTSKRSSTYVLLGLGGSGLDNSCSWHFTALLTAALLAAVFHDNLVLIVDTIVSMNELHLSSSIIQDTEFDGSA